MPNWVLKGKSFAEMYLSRIGPLVWIGKLYFDFGTKSEGPKNWKSGFCSPVSNGLSTLSGLFGGGSNAPKIEASDGSRGSVSGFLFSTLFVGPFCSSVFLSSLLLSLVARRARPKSELSRFIFAWLAETGFGGGVTENIDFSDGTFVVVVVLFVGAFVVVLLVVVVGAGFVVVVANAFSFSR